MCRLSFTDAELWGPGERYVARGLLLKLDIAFFRATGLVMVNTFCSYDPGPGLLFLCKLVLLVLQTPPNGTAPVFHEMVFVLLDNKGTWVSYVPGPRHLFKFRSFIVPLLSLSRQSPVFRALRYMIFIYYNKSVIT